LRVCLLGIIRCPDSERSAEDEPNRRKRKAPQKLLEALTANDGFREADSRGKTSEVGKRERL
jgi:hypothetical protein